ncbi:MAG TPA: heavy metal translocating P-type ATPase metal-binding domain-containing protein [Chryseosolibacter sp.]
MVRESIIENAVLCFHCGQACEEAHWLDDKPFCCLGCRTVYEILSANQLCEYYDLEKNPGVQLKEENDETFRYLEGKDIRRKILDFDSPSYARVTFHIPAIHCVSCVWLLENLHKIREGILKTEVNFVRKNAVIDFDPRKIQLGAIARLLGTLGYLPQINADAEERVKPKADRSLVVKVAIAGFCFGNVMLFSFPEYLGIDQGEAGLSRIFSWLNLMLSLPVFLYSGWDYMRSAAKSFSQRQVNIDVPIAAGLIALFLRSSYDIITTTGPGYFDSFTGLVFFLLIGRWFQNKTYETLSFERDYTSYFPLAVNRLKDNEWQPAVIYKLERNDIIRIRNLEIIPADSTLLDQWAYIDYSFVTGESRPVKITQGDRVYAGGRLIGSPVNLVVDKKTSQSHLTSLWNHHAFKKTHESRFQKIIDRAARKFTWSVLAIAFITALYWQFTDPSQVWLILSSVLMVACPCALALAAPFTFGSMLRVFGRNQLYLKNADVVERMARIDAVVFDKTGTVTHGQAPEIKSHGEWSDSEIAAIRTLTSYSTHPLSRMIAERIGRSASQAVTGFKEIPGQGIEGVIDGKKFRIGSPSFTGHSQGSDSPSATVFVSINDTPRGYFIISTSIRGNISAMLSRLGKKCVALLSGDRDRDRAEMQNIFNPGVEMRFNQSPQDKLDYIGALRQKGRRVMMVGDGLNDAGALKQSDVGIAVTDDTGVFTPACDGILHGSRIGMLDKYLDLARSAARVVKTGFGISFFYNAIALTFAVTGNLTPLTAAILMPLSSISVVGFSTLAVNFTAKRKLENP